MEQEIRFCTAKDSVNIAYASSGTGPPLVKAANWMNHLEYDWQSPVWRHLLEEFAADHQLIRYDERGTGLSDRKVTDLSLDAFVSDLEAVVDSIGLDRFPLFAISQGGPVAIAYTVRHPEKVSRLILLGTFGTGWKEIAGLPDAAIERRKAEAALIRHGWGNQNPAFRQIWTTLCIPDANASEAESFNELQRASVAPEMAANLFEAFGSFDVSKLLDQLDLPVLVLHAREDAVVSFDDGRRMASAIKGAKFVTLDSRDHLLLRNEPAWDRFVDEVRRFLGRERPRTASEVIEMSRSCPVCDRVYTGTFLYCLEDGSPLRENSTVSSHARSDPEATRLL